jgi:hypothetical protein
VTIVVAVISHPEKRGGMGQGPCTRHPAVLAIWASLAHLRVGEVIDVGTGPVLFKFEPHSMRVGYPGYVSGVILVGESEEKKVRWGLCG